MSNDKEKITSLLGDGEGQKMSKKKKMILGGVCIAVIAKCPEKNFVLFRR